MSDEESITGLGQINAEPRTGGAAVAKKEEDSFEGKSYEDATRKIATDDANDNYTIRKALKDQMTKAAPALFWSIFAVVVVLFAAFLALVGNYIHIIWQCETKVETLLGRILTHGLAITVGILIKAVFRTGNGRG